MAFTDDSLGRVNKRLGLSRSSRARTTVIGLRDLSALIGRLYAAERVCQKVEVPEADRYTLRELLDDWLKSAGRTEGQ